MFTRKHIHHRHCRFGFTLTELLVAIAVVAVLAIIIIPTISSVQSRASKTKCLSQLRQVGFALQNYLNDHNGIFPDSVGGGSSDRWLHRLDDYIEAEDYVYRTDIFHCTLTPRPVTDGTGVYGFNDLLAGVENARARRSIYEISDPTSLVVMAEKAHDVNSGPHLSPDSPYPVSHRGAAQNHNGYGNYLFADWRVESLSEWPGPEAFDPSLP